MASKELETLGNQLPYVRAHTEIELSEAERRYDAYLERKYKTHERLITGGMVINAASITAVFAAIEAGHTTLEKIGVSVSTCAISLGCFAAGAISSALAHWAENIVSPRWAADHYQRLAILRQKRSLFEQPGTQPVHQQLRQVQHELESHPPRDFRFSMVSTLLINLSGSTWLVGVGYAVWPIWSAQMAEAIDKLKAALN